MRTLTAIVAGSLLFVAAAGAPVDARGLVSAPIDADSVDGFDASADALPGHLLPLDGSGRLPLGVVPQGHGSGLDADTLDGKHLSEIVASARTDLQCSACVGLAELAFDPATQAELDAHHHDSRYLGLGAKAADAERLDGLDSMAFAPVSHLHDDRYFTETELSAPGAINLATNPVEWTKLRSVPSGFADGVDNTGGTATDVTCAACVDISELSFDPATQAELNALATAGTINTASNPVHWTKLTGVPSGFADGVDDAFSGAASDLTCTGCVSLGELGFDPATQTELNALAVAGTINSATNPVHWTKLNGVPSGFADGVDNTGGTATDVICIGCVGSDDLGPVAVTASKIAAGQVGVSHLSFDPATQTELNQSASQARAELDAHFVLTHAVQTVPRNVTTATVDSAGVTGKYPSVTLGPDGRPLISHADHTPGSPSVKVTRCGDGACSAGNVTVVIDAAHGEAGKTTIAMLGDRTVGVSYTTSAGDLVFARCLNATCSNGSSATVVDAGVAADSASVASLGGFPALVWVKGSNALFTRCQSYDCSGPKTVVTVATDAAAQATSIAEGVDGGAVISYASNVASLKAVKCAVVSCQFGASAATVDPGPQVGAHSSIAVGTDGLPVISYRDAANQRLKIAKCGNLACTAGNVLATAPSSTIDQGTSSSIAVPADGLPVISYVDAVTMQVMATKCLTPSCSSTATAEEVGSGPHAAIGVGADGLALVAYFSQATADLQTAKCPNTFCKADWSRRN